MNIPTTDEMFKEYSELCQFEEFTEYLVDKEDFKQALIEFAKLHVEAALNQACESAVLGKEGAFGTYWNRGDLVLDKESVLNCYPPKNII